MPKNRTLTRTCDIVTDGPARLWFQRCRLRLSLMPSSISLDRMLGRLEAAKRQFGTGQGADVAKLLQALGRRRFNDAGSLIRFHEALLFFRAYPPNRSILRLAESLLGSIAGRIAGNPEAFEEPDVSGIAGTAFSAIFTYDI